MNNNIKKVSVMFWEDLLYFHHFMQVYIIAQIRDYNHHRQIEILEMLFILCL